MAKVIIIPWQGKPRPHDIETQLYNLQHYVGGFIEPCAPAELRAHRIELLADEEGLLKHLPCNPNLFPFFFVGNLVMVGVSDEDFVGLTDEQVTFALQWLANLEGREG